MEKQSSITDNVKIKAAIEATGVTCNSFAGGRSYAGAPFIKENGGVCFHFAANSGWAPKGVPRREFSVCNANQYQEHSPLCYCKPPTKSKSDYTSCKILPPNYLA